jgi:serine/threonine-protein kinase HipA
MSLPAKIRQLNVTINGAPAGELIKESTYMYVYAGTQAEQPSVALLMPPTRRVYQDGDLFPPMDMNLPEGYLIQRIMEMYPKLELTKMQLLALMGTNGIGRLGYELPQVERPAAPAPVSKETILDSGASGDLFRSLVHAYLSTGAGISGVQPKIMVPTRATLPIPDLIVKTQGPDFPNLSVNEYLCLSAARNANVPVPAFDLSRDGSLLVLERFDLTADGARLGFEDFASLAGLRVTDRLSNRKYHGSYEAVADIISDVSGENRVANLRAFYEQIALSVMVRNGDAHLKNFGLLYNDASDVRVSPLFDVVTTSVYRFERPGGVETEDRTMALKWRRSGKYNARPYPGRDELLTFGRKFCAVTHPQEVITRLAAGMRLALAQAKDDPRVPAGFLETLREQWEIGLAYDDGAASAGSREP